MISVRQYLFDVPSDSDIYVHVVIEGGCTEWQFATALLVWNIFSKRSAVRVGSLKYLLPVSVQPIDDICAAIPVRCSIWFRHICACCHRGRLHWVTICNSLTSLKYLFQKFCSQSRQSEISSTGVCTTDRWYLCGNTCSMFHLIPTYMCMLSSRAVALSDNLQQPY